MCEEWLGVFETVGMCVRNGLVVLELKKCEGKGPRVCGYKEI